MRAASLVLALALVAPTAAAATATDVIGVPVGWTERDLDARARARADGWLRGRDDARALAVLSTRARDDFAETLAVIELDGALDRRAPIDDEMRRALAGIAPTGEVTIEPDVVPDAAASARARWIAGDVAHEAVLVPSGPTRRLVLLAVRADELPLYRSTMREALAGLTGVADPIEPFATKPLRRWTIAAWAILTTAALGLAMWRRPFGASPRTIGRVLAMACLVLAALTVAIAWSPLERSGDALRVAGLSPTTMAAELVTYGLLAAVCCWIAGMLIARREGPVASAPTTGAFADRSHSIPRVPVAERDSARASGTIELGEHARDVDEQAR